MQPAQDSLGVAEIAGDRGSSLAEQGSAFGIVDQGSQGQGQRAWVVGLDQHAASRSDDLQCTAKAGRDHGPLRVHGLDKGDSKRLRPRVRLAVDIGGGQEPGHVGAWADNADAIGDPRREGGRLQAVQVRRFSRTLRPAGEPGDPLGMVPEQGESVERRVLALSKVPSG